MRPGNHPVSVVVALIAFMALAAQAQLSVPKADNNLPLDQGGSWTTGVAPTASDTAVWGATVQTADNCSNTVTANLSWGGIRIVDPVAPVKVTSTNTLNLGSSGIDLNLGGTSQDLWLAMSVATTSDQAWNIKSGRLLTLGDASRNVNIQNTVTPVGHLSYVQNLQVLSPGILNIGDGALIDPGGAVVSGATVNFNSVVNQSGGTLKVRRASGSSGSPAASLSVASSSGSSGIYNITGGSLIDISPADTAWIVMGGGSSANGTLNVDGTASLQLVKVLLGNSTGATGTMNLSNGTVYVASTVFDVGRSSGGAHGFVNVYGGTLAMAGGSMNLGRGPGDGTLTIAGGTANLNGLNVSGANSGAGPGTVNVTSGSLTVTNNLTLAANGSAGSAIVNLDGGTATVGAVTRGTGAGSPVQFNMNGGLLRPRANSGSFIAAAVPAYVKAGGAIVDTAGFNVTCAAPLLDGAGGGGLTKQGAGRLTLSNTNTYTGSTLVSAGDLYLNTTIHTGGEITVNDGARLRTTLALGGTTMPCASLALGVASGATVEFDLGTNANATVPLVYATNLTAKGTVGVNVYGTALSQGVISLIQYDGSVGGGGTFNLAFVQGWSGYLTNNTAVKQIQLVITEAETLAWRALVNTNWDTATANWYDLTNGAPSTFSGGANTYFDDSTSNALVYLTATLAPGSMNLVNSQSNYTFTGVGQVAGVGGLTKLGSGMVTMAVSNSYSGATLINSGLFRLGANGAIPANGAVVEGTLEMGGFSDNVGSLNCTNGMVINSSNSPVVLGVTGGAVFGLITNSGGSLALNKTGGSTLTLLAKNGYSGATTNGGGTMVLAYEQSISPGPLAIGSATLAWLDAGPHTVANPVTLIGSPTFGNGLNGPLTIPNVVDLAGGSYTITCNTNSDVLLANGMVNGGLTAKNGPAQLTLRHSTSRWLNNTFLLSRGTLVLADNSAVVLENGNTRIRCSADNETARFVINTGCSYTMSNTASQNFRFGDGTSAGANSSNVLDISGRLTITPYTGTGSRLQMGSSSDPAQQNILNLLPGGLLQVKQIRDESPVSSSTFNFNGGTLSPNSDEVASTFMQFLDACYVLDGGAFIDTAGFTVTIGQDIQSGGSGTGGLTKRGAGKLNLNGNDTYGGPTVVEAGALGGTGTLNTPVTVQANASLEPGVAIGSLTINSTLTLQSGSTTVMEVSNDNGVTTSDSVVGPTTVQYGGTLVVKNVGPTPLASGNVFTLFSAGTRLGSFAAYQLPALPLGLAWDTSKLGSEGSIAVTGTALFAFMPAVVIGDDLVVSGSGGTPSGTYQVISSSNVALPRSSWTPVATGTFDAFGNFSFTNAINRAGPPAFFSIYFQR